MAQQLDLIEKPQAEVRAGDLNGGSLPPIYDDWWYEPIKSTKSVSQTRAEAIAAAYACVDVRAKTVAMLPANVFERLKSGDKKELRKHFLYRLLRHAPNPWMDSYDFFFLVESHLLWRGNFYAYIDRIGSTKEIINLIPLNPDLMDVEIRAGRNGAVRLVYVFYDEKNQAGHEYDSDQIFHLKENSKDGFKGRSKLDIAGDVFTYSKSLQDHNISTFQNGARPDGLLSTDGVFKDREQVEAMRRDWNRIYGGAQNAGKIAILEQGLKYQPIAMTSENAQLIERERFSVEQMARIFDVPPYRIQDYTRATFSNVEEASLNFGKNTIQPRTVQIERAIKRQLLIRDRDEDVFVKFNLDSLYRGDLKTRTEAHNAAIQNGWMSRDEVRALEDMNKMPDGQGEQFLVPVNLAPADKLDDIYDDNIADEKPDEQPESQEPGGDERKQLFAPLFRDIFGRLCRRENKQLVCKRSKGILLESVEEFFAKHQGIIEESILPAVVAYGCDEPGQVTRRFAFWYCQNRRGELALAPESAAREDRVDHIFELLEKKDD